MKWLVAFIPMVAAAPGYIPLPDQNFGTPPPPGTVQIKGITYGGNGCPQGTMSSQLSNDRTTVTLIFDSYIASIGPGIAVTEQRKNCQLNVAITYPGGFQYSILSADYRGYANLQKGTTTQYDFVGPVIGDYLKHDEADSTSVVWSPCGAEGMLNINSQVRMTATNTSATGLLTTDSTDLKFAQVVYVQWQACKK
ncbi:hypothetical protein K505DRAFT_338331 [Melanomma pulvis-pyrius CBS 109.77]|uniref:DUF4360 domain-containing protein n=1 Tax=Melanomma pulvis-pyrius CBS 109.77 TaxID=1314802 RepID=A0A6A6X9A2_9PLEO|nr:hypothetical protein K505DRAFT_338331 [Melanomma pulvis-pyrius CBS 109.77]